MSNNKELKGLGGWLVLVGIGIIVAPFRLAYEFGPLYYSIFTDGTFQMLTTSGTDYYHELWAPLLILEAVYNSVMVLASFYLIYLFFSKHYLFPKFFIGVSLLAVFFIPLDAWLASFIFPEEPIFDPDTLKGFARALGSAVIWIPYMLVSKRVKATFREYMPNPPQGPDASEARASA